MEGEKLGPFRIERTLGSGGMGKVYAAKVRKDLPGLEIGTTVAVKVIHAHVLEHDTAFQRFRREAEIGRKVLHPNVVQTYDAGVVTRGGKKAHILVMEYVEGQTLRDLLHEVHRVPESLCRHIGREVAKGLVAIHDMGVIHRDLKPENVLITGDQAVKVMDLGVARLVEGQLSLSKTGAFIGTCLYAAPEQFTAAKGGIDGRLDLYALGVMLYELVTGRNPFRADDSAQVMHRVLHEEPRRASDINPQVSSFLEETIHKLMSKDPARRFQTAAQLVDVLENGESSGWWEKRAVTIRSELDRPLRRIPVPRDTALYGRSEEVANLRSTFSKVREGGGRVVLLEGEAGVGKTRLVDQVVHELVQEGERFHFLFGSYPPSGAATVSGAFIDAFREHLGLEGLEERLRPYLSKSPLLVPAFAALLRGNTTPAVGQVLTKDSLQSVFVNTLRALSAERPTVLVIEDLHFAPEEGRALFAALALAIPEHRVLLIGSARHGVSEEWLTGIERLPHARKLGLGRLGPKELGKLLVDAFEAEGLAEDLGYEILTKSDGNPYFVFEIIRGLKESGQLEKRADGSWKSTGVIAGIEIPSSLRELIQARIASLDSQARDVLDVASCCGVDFDPLIVGDVVGLTRIPILKCLAQVERAHRLVRSSGRRFRFDHHQVQEALHDGLPEMLREEYHAQLGEGLEARVRERGTPPEQLDGATAVELCTHFLASAKWERALPYLHRAIDHFADSCMHDAAAKLASRALGIPTLIEGAARVELLLKLEERLAMLGRKEERRQALEEALSAVDRLLDSRLRILVRLRAGTFYRIVGPLEEAEAVLREASELAQHAGDSALHARALGVLGHVYTLQGEDARALEQLAAALVLARTAGDRSVEAKTRTTLGIALAGQGRLTEAREHFEFALALRQELCERQAVALTTGNLGLVLFRLGELKSAQEHLKRSLDMARDQGDRPGEGTACGNLGHVYVALGRFDDARRCYQRDLTLAKELGDQQAEANAHGAHGTLCLRYGQMDEALTHLNKHLELARAMGYREGVAIALVNLGTLHARMGNTETARRSLKSAQFECESIGARYPLGYVHAARALLTSGNGDATSAQAHAEQALALRREIQHRDGIADSLLQLGRILSEGGKLVEAAAHLRESQRIAEEIGSPGPSVLAVAYLAALPDGDVATALKAFTALGERLTVFEELEARYLIWRATGAPDHLAEAYRRLQQVRAHTPKQWRDGLIQNVPLHRDIWAVYGGDGEAETLA